MLPSTTLFRMFVRASAESHQSYEIAAGCSTPPGDILVAKTIAGLQERTGRPAPQVDLQYAQMLRLPGSRSRAVDPRSQRFRALCCAESQASSGLAARRAVRIRQDRYRFRLSR